MARKKKTEKKQEVKQPKLRHIIYDKGTIIIVPFEQLPGNVLGGKYEYNGIPVRLVYIGEPSKLEVI